MSSRVERSIIGCKPQFFTTFSPIHTPGSRGPPFFCFNFSALDRTTTCNAVVRRVNDVREVHVIPNTITWWQKLIIKKMNAEPIFQAGLPVKQWILLQWPYVDGISLTHRGAGGHHHIWTFAAGLTEVSSSYPNEECPCDTLHYDHVPTFVGSDYFCESGLHSEWNDGFRLYPDDVLWDGQGCTAHSTCCQFNNPPWFTKYLPNATANNIELRLCTSSGAATDDIPIELIELYVQ